jgi:hypothetical protein
VEMDIDQKKGVLTYCFTNESVWLNDYDVRQSYPHGVNFAIVNSWLHYSKHLIWYTNYTDILLSFSLSYICSEYDVNYCWCRLVKVWRKQYTSFQ